VTAAAPSAWIVRWAHLIAPGGSVLDVAAGSGRHAAWLARRGHAVTAVDRDGAAMRPLAGRAEVVVADLEAGPWPFAGRTFAAIVVTNYLWRPLFPALENALAPAGALLYETFAAGNESVGRPARAEFLLAGGELLAAFPGLRTVAFEDGFLSDPERFVQRLAAVRELAPPGLARYRLTAPGGVGGGADPAR
jgi:SAM-dependent methyltransferase